jgi:hypothetical protein
MGVSQATASFRVASPQEPVLSICGRRLLELDKGTWRGGLYFFSIIRRGAAYHCIKKKDKVRLQCVVVSHTQRKNGKKQLRTPGVNPGTQRSTTR